MRFNQRRQDDPDINLIPFIDVLLVVVIFLMLSTTEITLAPGWRCTLSNTAGVLSAQLDSLVFSAPSITVATSDRCTGALFL